MSRCANMAVDAGRGCAALRQRGRVQWWWLLAVLLAMLLAWSGWWFFTHYERVSETRRLPPRGEAVSNPYYAAELFLRRQGLEVQSVGSSTPLVRLPASGDVMLVRNMGASVAEHHVDAILDWVQRGGRLVLESHDVLSDPQAALKECRRDGCDEQEWEDAAEEAQAATERVGEEIEHPLLARLGIYLIHADSEVEDEADSETESVETESVETESVETESVETESSAASDSEAQQAADAVRRELQALAEQEQEGEDEYEEVAPATVALPGGDTARVAINDSFTLVDSEKVAAQRWAHKDITHMLRVDRGKGSIWVLSDTQFMQSRRARRVAELLADSVQAGVRASVDTYDIQRHDHAYFLYQLLMHNGTGAAAKPGKVWLLYNADAKPLHQLLWDNARWAIKGFVLLLLVWLWWLNNRFGPPLGKLDPPRRNLLEHLRMSGSFAWQQDGAKRLWLRNREQILTDIVRKHPRLSAMNADEQAKTLADMTGYPVSSIHSALFTQPAGERDFVYLTDMLRRIRKKV